MSKKWMALLLASALTLSLCVIPALAQTDAPPQAAEGEAAAESDSSGEPDSAGDTGPAGEDAGTFEEVPLPEETIVVQPDGTPAAKSSTMDDELVFTGEDDFRYLAFENLRDRVLEGSLTARMLEESIASIDAMDFTEMYINLVSQLNSLEYAQEMYAQIPVATPFEGAMQGYVISNLASSYGSLSGTVSDLATGKLQKDYAAAKRQLKNAQDLTVVGAESLYFAILELEQTKATLQRNLAAVNRSMDEMELRYKLGQISALTLEQVKDGKATLQSNLSTLEMNLRRCKLQMQSMAGASLNGSLTLGPLPALSQDLIDSMNYDLDLAEAKDRSYDLFAAKKKLDEASDTFDSANQTNARTTYTYRTARHTYEAAKFEYQMSMQNFEMSFRNAFDSVKDYQRVLNSSYTSLAFQESSYAAAEMKYRQGSISHNALLEAEDELSAAKDTVATAKRNLFTAFRTYYWAVNYGVMNNGQTGQTS